jgi:hypothetical protein
LQRHKSFFKIRERIIGELDRRLSNSKTDSQQGKSDNGEKVLQRDSTQQNQLAMKKLAAEVKTKALNVLKCSKGKTELAFLGSDKDSNVAPRNYVITFNSVHHFLQIPRSEIQQNQESSSFNISNKKYG